MDTYDEPVPEAPEGFDVEDMSTDVSFLQNQSTEQEERAGGSGQEDSEAPRRSRWTRESGKVIIPGAPILLPSSMDEEQKKAWMIRVRLEEISRKVASNTFDIDYGPDRSPSPEPTYDSQGKRTNTREQRARTKLNKERQFLVELAQKMSPIFKPPSDYRPEHVKKTLKVYIPDFQDHPGHKFIGLIIGPRGNTQKKMERESGAKIAIRGKGSVKEGKARKDGKLNPGEDEKLHVLLIADTDEQIRKAEKMVRSLLVPIEEGKNEHKRQQLRELASINGTLREEEICRTCGAVGHRFWNCPDRGGVNWKPADIRCAICGETSHITKDCTNQEIRENPAIDAEYESFMAELGESKGPSPFPSGGAPSSGFMQGASAFSRPPPPLPLQIGAPPPPPIPGGATSAPPPLPPSIPGGHGAPSWQHRGPPPPPLPSTSFASPNRSYGPPPLPAQGATHGAYNPYGPPPTPYATAAAPSYGSYGQAPPPPLPPSPSPSPSGSHSSYSPYGPSSGAHSSYSPYGPAHTPAPPPPPPHPAAAGSYGGAYGHQYGAYGTGAQQHSQKAQAGANEDDEYSQFMASIN